MIIKTEKVLFHSNHIKKAKMYLNQFIKFHQIRQTFQKIIKNDKLWWFTYHL